MSSSQVLDKTDLDRRESRPGVPFHARGPLSRHLLDVLTQRPEVVDNQTLADLVDVAIEPGEGIIRDDDLQLALFLCYSVHYGSVAGLHAEWEWHPALITLRRRIELEFEAELRKAVVVPAVREGRAADVAQALFELTSDDTGPSLSKFVARQATDVQLHELVVQRSIYTLREADPHSWAIPRLTGRPKAALVEIQADEYGGGRPERMHAVIFARTMEGLGLSPAYAEYVDNVPAVTLASLNMMSMFGLNRRLLGAIVGHLAAFEMTSSIPNRFYGNGFRRAGYDTRVTEYFDEHVEADAVHEQIAALDLAGGLAEQQPDLLADIMFGAAACLYVDGLVGSQILEAWAAGRSSLRQPL
jgi:hypothetical protein